MLQQLSCRAHIFNVCLQLALSSKLPLQPPGTCQAWKIEACTPCQETGTTTDTTTYRQPNLSLHLPLSQRLSRQRGKAVAERPMGQHGSAWAEAESMMRALWRPTRASESEGTLTQRPRRSGRSCLQAGQAAGSSQHTAGWVPWHSGVSCTLHSRSGPGKQPASQPHVAMQCAARRAAPKLLDERASALALVCMPPPTLYGMGW